ncbi:MAG: hypothetical protein ACRD3B_16955 [Candidatus Sulfotelmatobacter sp.]
MRAKTPRTSPTRQQLNPRLDKMIATYATAAGAVGVGLLAAAQPADAKVVYTKTRVTIGSFYHLDLNHDGIGDFNINFCSCEPESTPLVVSSRRGVGNAVVEQPGYFYAPAALKSGAPIGSKQPFKTVYGNIMILAAAGYSTSGKPTSYGQWLGVTDRYLGVKFIIGGEVHFGWARLTVGKRLSHVVLTGYAYETIANRPIKAGQTSETPQDEVKNAATLGSPAEGPSLGMLAGGADALPTWRKEAWRREEAIA